MVKLNIFIFSFFLNSIVVSNEIITIEIDGSNLPETQGEILRGKKFLKKIVANAMAILLKDQLHLNWLEIINYLVMMFQKLLEISGLML